MLSVSKDEEYVPIDCPICELMIRDSRDSSRYYASGCCVECWIGFLEPLRKLNLDEGYLPTRGELEAYRKKVGSTITNLENKQC